MRPAFLFAVAALLLTACAHPCRVAPPPYEPGESFPNQKDLLIQQATCGDRCAGGQLGIQYELAGDCQNALKWYRKFSNTCPIAAYNLGLNYERGPCLPIDKRAAMRWHKKSVAIEPFAPAMTRIATLYLNDDDVATRAWFEKAVAAGDPVAELSLASMYMNGAGGGKNYEKALPLAMSGAKRREPQALEIVGLIYANGYGTPKDLVRGYHYLKMSADAGSDESKILLEQVALMMTRAEIERAYALREAQ